MAKVKLYLPPNFSENKKYPLMIEVYGGPNFPQVSNNLQINQLFNQTLLISLKYTSDLSLETFYFHYF